MLVLFCYINIEFSDCQTFIQFLKIYQNVTISIPLTSMHQVFTVNKKKSLFTSYGIQFCLGISPTRTFAESILHQTALLSAF